MSRAGPVHRVQSCYRFGTKSPNHQITIRSSKYSSVVELWTSKNTSLPLITITSIIRLTRHTHSQRISTEETVRNTQPAVQRLAQLSGVHSVCSSPVLPARRQGVGHPHARSSNSRRAIIAYIASNVRERAVNPHPTPIQLPLAQPVVG